MNATSFQFDLLARILDSSGLRHRVIANNVANVNTPNYKRLDVSFEDDLAQAIRQGTSPSQVQLKIIEDINAPERVDGNTVDIDQEMNNLNKNSLLYEAAAQILASRVASLRSAITGQ